MMDRPAIVAAEDFCHPGYPLDVEGLLICELDGPEAEVLHLIEVVGAIARQCGATVVRVSQDEAERQRFWLGRKSAFPAVGRISPDYYCMDGTIPRAKLPYVLARMREMSEHYGLRVANVFHAGDGNLHPLILYDANQPGQLERTEEFGAEILKLCVEVGGVLTGEHGVGVEKRDLMPVMFNEDDLNQQQRVKCAFDPDPDPQPGQGLPQAPPLRRTRPPPRPPRPAPLPRPAAVLGEIGPVDLPANSGSSALKWARNGLMSAVMIRPGHGAQAPIRGCSLATTSLTTSGGACPASAAWRARQSRLRR